MSLRFAILKTIRTHTAVRLVLSEAQIAAGVGPDAAAVKEDEEIILEYEPEEVIEKLVRRTFDSLGPSQVSVLTGVFPWRKVRQTEVRFAREQIKTAMKDAFWSMVKEFKHKTVAHPAS